MTGRSEEDGGDHRCGTQQAQATATHSRGRELQRGATRAGAFGRGRERGAAPRGRAASGRGGWAGGGVRPGAGRAELREGRCHCSGRRFQAVG